MTINGNYSAPVSVNGYQCWNCTDVDNAKKHIDPQHPKAGPYGIDAASDPSLRNNPKTQAAVIFGGALSDVTEAGGAPGPANAQGASLDITV
jgi:hypothetical protein